MHDELAGYYEKVFRLRSLVRQMPFHGSESILTSDIL